MSMIDTVFGKGKAGKLRSGDPSMGGGMDPAIMGKATYNCISATGVRLSQPTFTSRGHFSTAIKS